MRTLLWLYFWLLIFEGALRNWVFPGKANLLLVVRDPVVLFVYVRALQSGLFPKNMFVTFAIGLAIASSLTALAFGHGNLAVTLYGIRTNFFHIPLIFIFAAVFKHEDVVNIGRIVLTLCIPMALLVIYQFESAPDSWINVAGMRTHYGTVRPSGTFSFISGLVAFIALATSFLGYGFIEKTLYRKGLLIFSAALLIVMVACSGSRSAVFGVLLVFATLLSLAFVHKGAATGGILTLGVIALAFSSVGTTEVVQEGSDQMVRRFQDAAGAAGGSLYESTVGRILDGFTAPFKRLSDPNLFGEGLGKGTNVAAFILTGQRGFIGPEGEWDRLLWESGPVIGLMQIIMRVLLTFSIFRHARLALQRDKNPLPLLLFGGCFLAISMGQWGVPTIQGFSIFSAALCLVSSRPFMRDPEVAHSPAVATKLAKFNRP